MRSEFQHYFKPNESEIEGLWGDGLFSFDASVLLNVYGYSKETCAELVAFFERNAERIRLPHQFALEFCRNRTSVIIKQVNNYHTAEKDLKRILDEHFMPKRDHPYLSAEAMQAFQGILDELAESRVEMEKLISDDPYCGRMLKAFEGKVSPEPTVEEYKQLHKQAKERYAAYIPPGYCDLKEKAEPDAYGDCIAWLQLIQIACNEKKDLVLTIDDLKEDWWYIERGRTVGPQPRLLQEFLRSSGQKVYLYNSEGFLRAAKLYGAAEIGDRAIEEVRSRLESQRETNRTDSLKSVAPPTVLTEVKMELSPSEDKITGGIKPVSPVPSAAESLKSTTEGEGTI
jgi:hypothetical protein